jgi:hypothetical protein
MLSLYHWYRIILFLEANTRQLLVGTEQLFNIASVTVHKPHCSWRIWTAQACPVVARTTCCCQMHNMGSAQQQAVSVDVSAFMPNSLHTEVRPALVTEFSYQGS